MKNQKYLCRHLADSNDFDRCSNTLMLTHYAIPKQGWCSIRKAEFDVEKDSPWFCIMKDKNGQRFEMETKSENSAACTIVQSSFVLILTFVSSQYF